MQDFRITPALHRGLRLTTAAVLLSLFSLCPQSHAQQTAVTTQVASADSAPVVPQQVRFAGLLPNRTGDTVEAVFRIYSAAEGGQPLWTETQKISVAQDGSYTVLLGAASTKGLPQTVFGSGQARWVGIAVERGEEEVRIPLASAPYAMKAGDAQTLGGLSPRSFVTQSQLAATAQALAEQATAQITPDVTPTGTGTTNYVPLWTSSTNLGNSVLYQSTTKVGINTITPTASLHVVGPTNGAIGMVLQSGGGFGSLRVGADVNASSLTPSVRKLARFSMPDWANDSQGVLLFSGDITSAAANDMYFGGATGSPLYGPTTLHFFTSPTSTTVGGTEKMTITSSGNVGIGTTAPAAKLEVNGTAKFDGLVTFASSQTFPAGGSIPHNATLTGNGTGASPLGVTVPLVLSASANGVVQGTDTGAGYGVAGSSASGVGVYGNGGSSGGFGMEGVATGATGIGVFGNASTLSNSGQTYRSFDYGAGVWADSNASSSSSSYFALVGTADDTDAAVFYNNSSESETLAASNFNSSSGAPVASFGGNGGHCIFDNTGSFFCSGTKSSVVNVDNDTRKVALYAVEAPENWFEDFGSGQLAEGAVTVQLEPTFAQTVNLATNYKVFLTPNGDCKGLYVTNKTANGFEVRELGGGKSSVDFDYRIVAHRKGYEKVRLADRTKQSESPTLDRMKAARAPR